MIKFTKALFLTLIGFHALAQDNKPVWYNNKFIFTNKPDSAKEYTYDYDTKEEKLSRYHTFTYTPKGQIATHVETNEGISSWFQTFRYRFSYDETGRLIYYWQEQYSSFSNTYTSQREEQWVYDAFGMLVEHHNWSVSNGTKYQNSDSEKRIITREKTSNKVLKIDVLEYSSFEEAFELTQSLEFKYKPTGKLDTLKVYRKNVTLGGVMQLDQNRYGFGFHTENYLNTDSLRYSTYTFEDWYPRIRTKVFTYDANGRLTNELTKDAKGDKEAESTFIYETDKVTKTDNDYQKTISYLDQSGYEYKNETYSNNNGTWELDGPSWTLSTRTFVGNKIKEELVQTYSSTISAYEKQARYVYIYPGSLGISDASPALEVAVAPNPTSGYLTISNSDRVSAIRLIKADGTSKAIGVSSSIVLNEMPGCYILRIAGKEGNYADHKIVVY